MSKKGCGRTAEQQREYMREYMRARRAGTWQPVNRVAANSKEEGGAALKQSQATYDPSRDGPCVHENLTAVLMGDPPIGRRAIDR